MSCTQQPTFETRVEKILYEINDPESAYIVVAFKMGTIYLFILTVISF